jgi:uncharacterized protein (DUF433 family)
MIIAATNSAEGPHLAPDLFHHNQAKRCAARVEFGINLIILVDPQVREMHNKPQGERKIFMSTEYIQLQGDVYRIAGSRVSLDSIVYAFWNGESAETIAQSFPVLTLEQVYGAITFYLAHKDEVDRYLEQRRVDYEAKRQAARDADPMFYQKIAEDRRRSLTSP